jgi:hypothetical protein
MKTSSLWYIPIVIVLVLGYGIGGCLVFGLHFLNWFPSLTNDTARLVLKLFGMAMLGSTMYCTEWWANDIEEALKKPKILPHAFDFCGYATLIIGGGITGTVLYMAIRSGAVLTISNPSNTDINICFALVVAFCGGLFHFRVKKWMESVIEVIKKSE